MRIQLHRQIERYMQENTCLLFLVITQTDPHGYQFTQDTVRCRLSDK